MGSKSPHVTNTVGTEKIVCWRKPVIGGNPEKAERFSFEVRVGRTAVVDGIVTKNGYGDVRLVHHNLFLF